MSHEHIHLNPGDVVLVRRDDKTEAEYEVRIAPWRLGHGQWVVGLKGIAGGYSLDRVVRLVRFAESKAKEVNPAAVGAVDPPVASGEKVGAT